MTDREVCMQEIEEYSHYDRCPNPQCNCPASEAYEGFCWFHSYLATPQRRLDVLQDSPVRAQTSRETFFRFTPKWDRARFSLYRRQRMRKWLKGKDPKSLKVAFDFGQQFGFSPLQARRKIDRVCRQC